VRLSGGFYIVTVGSIPLLDVPGGLEASCYALSRLDVEVQDVLTDTESRIERDGRIITEIGLDIDDPRAPRRSDVLKLLDEHRRDAAAPV
jgi:hypothetical protein